MNIKNHEKAAEGLFNALNLAAALSPVLASLGDAETVHGARLMLDSISKNLDQVVESFCDLRETDNL